MILKYNGKSAFVEQINDKPVIRFRDLTRLSVNPDSSLYGLLTKKQDELCGEIIKKSHRSTYITLECCIKLLNFCRDPDDGLIMEISRFLNSDKITADTDVPCFDEYEVITQLTKLMKDQQND